MRAIVFVNKASISPVAPELMELSFKMFDSDSILKSLYTRLRGTACMCSYQYTLNCLQFAPYFDRAISVPCWVQRVQIMPVLCPATIWRMGEVVVNAENY